MAKSSCTPTVGKFVVVRCIRLLLSVLAVMLLLPGALESSRLSAQQRSPYVLRATTGIAFGGAGVASYVLGERASARMEVLTPEQIARLDAREVWAIDRLATRQGSAFAKTVSDASLYGAVLLPSLFLLNDRSRRHGDDVGLIYAQVLSLNYGLTSLVKNTTQRPRPYVYDSSISLTRKQSRDARRSFFSGHTSMTAASTFFTARVYSDFYPDAAAKPWVWTGAIVLPAVTGATRVLAGKHYLTDVLVGYAVGAGIGLLVPELQRRKE